MTETKPMSTQQPQAPAQPNEQAAREQADYFEKAVERMKDRALHDQVRAFHPHAATSREATDAMLADYQRLEKEHAAQKENR